MNQIRNLEPNLKSRNTSCVAKLRNSIWIIYEKIDIKDRSDGFFSLFSIAKKRYRMPFRAKFGFLTPFFSLSLMEKSAPHLRVDVSYQPNHFIDTVCVCCLSHSMSVYYSKWEIESTYFKVYTHLLVGISLVRKTKIYRFRYVCVRVLVCVSFETLSHWMFSEANGDPCILLSI